MTEEESSMAERVRAYYGIIFPSEDPGGSGSFLQPSTDPRKGTSKQTGRTEARELSTMSQR